MGKNSSIHINKSLCRIVHCAMITILLFTSLYSQPNFYFDYLDISNGLPHNTVFTILQDVNGYIWLGTQDGLVRYDSKSTKIFNRNTDNNFNGKNIQCLIENKVGDLFIGTRGNGIIVKSGRTGKFSSLDNKQLDSALATSWIKHLMIDQNERLWISTLDNGLWMYDQKTQNFLTFSKSNTLLHSSQISSTVEDKEGNIWIASSSDRLFIVKAGTTNVEEAPISNTQYFGFRKTLFCDKLGRIWLGTEGHGLYMIDPYKNVTQSYNTINGLSSNTVTHIAAWEDNHLLIATDGGGLNVLDMNNQKLYLYKSQNGKSSLNTNALYYINIDKDQNLWIGTYNGGVNISKKHKMIFENYQIDERTQEDKSIKSILSISKSAPNKLWIGTDGDGIYTFDLVNKTMASSNELFNT
ncbi:MAG TPA: two-component regulator propeller domain-containing protein, partial [Saprospiraceae bacterium]|nr:two-component regulator propeller domain-containing protein [Saprospiraceae bacterium]